MNNFTTFLQFGNLIPITHNMTPVAHVATHGGYDDAVDLEKAIKSTYANGVGLVCGDGVVAVQYSRKGFKPLLRFNEMVAEWGGIISPYAVIDRLGGQIWHLYRSTTNEKTWSYLEPFSGYINVIGKGGFVPLPGDLLGRFEWLGYTPESPEDLPPAMEWLFPSYYSSL